MESGKPDIGKRLSELASEIQALADECGYSEESEESEEGMVEESGEESTPMAAAPKRDKVSLATSLFQRSK